MIALEAIINIYALIKMRDIVKKELIKYKGL